jgi:zinc protease
MRCADPTWNAAGEASQRRSSIFERAAGWAVVVSALLVACGGPRPQPAAPSHEHAPSEVSEVPPRGEPALPLWPEVKRGKLANGLTYYVLRHRKPEHRALLWLAVNAGSLLEDDDQRGLAHFAEHMAFNGTRRFPKAEIVDYLESIGMRFGADLNARTGYDDTVYELEVPTDAPGFLTKGLDILRDWAGDVSYDPAEVDKERGVVKEEWRLGRGAQQRVFDHQAPVIFHATRYAVRQPIGLPEVLDKAPRDRLVRFYQDWYRPDLMAVIAVGDFADPGAIEREIQARFGDLKNPAQARPRITAGAPAADGTRISIVADRELASTTVSIYNLVPHRPGASRSDFRRLVVEQVYQAIANERFATIARRPDAPFVVAAAGIASPVREIDAFVRAAEAKPGQAAATLDRLATEIARISQHGVTQGEIDRARAILARGAEQNLAEEATSHSRGFTEELTRNFFASELVIGRAAEHQLMQEILPTITLAELDALAGQFGGAANRVILVAGPEPGAGTPAPPAKAASPRAAPPAPPLPNREQVLAIIDAVGKRTLEPWQDQAVPTALMIEPPKPGTITQEARVAAIGATAWTLSNGARVIVKPTDFEADQVALLGRSPGGLATASGKAFDDARFADQIAAVGGLGELDTEQLGKLLAGKHVAAAASIGETTERVDASASVRDLETMLQLVHLQMTRPRKDDRAIAVWRANLADELANQQRVPEVQLSQQSDAVLYQRNPRRAPPDPAALARLDPDAALAFYKDRFGDASDFTFVIVGAVDLTTLRPLVATYLASLPARGRKERENDVGIRKVRGVVKRAFRLGQEPKARVSLVFHADDAWTRDRDRDGYILGEVLGIRLREVLREDKGGVYGVAVGGSVVRSPRQERNFTISFGCDPGRVDELVKATLDEIAAIQRDGIGPEILEKVKQTFLRERDVELRTNGFWLGWLSLAYSYGDDPALVLDPSQMAARMTSALVKAAARRYLDPKQYYAPVLLPER